MQTTIEKIEQLNILLIGLGAGISWATEYVHVPSLIVGGVVMQVNFWLLKKVVRTALSPSAHDVGGKSRAPIWFVAKAELCDRGLFTAASLHDSWPVRIKK